MCWKKYFIFSEIEVFHVLAFALEKVLSND